MAIYSVLRENLLYFFCVCSRTFWTSIEQWIRQIYNVHIPLKITDILFGIVHLKTQDDLLPNLNYILVYAKWFLYTCKKESKPFPLKNFLNYLKYILSIEHQVSLNRNTSVRFNTRWSVVIENI